MTLEERIREIQPENIDSTILYKGWVIWCWTGWKGEKTKALCSVTMGCPICSKPFLVGQDIFVNQSQIAQHWTCHYPDNRPDRLIGQWLAVQLDPNDTKHHRHLYSCAGSHTFGEYKRGECFYIDADVLITEHSSERDKDEEKAAGLKRLKLLIDQLEGF